MNRFLGRARCCRKVLAWTHLGSGLSLAGYGMVWVKDIFMTLHAAHPHRESVHVRHVHGCHVSCMRGADIQVPPWEVPAPTPRMPDHEACCHHPHPLGGAADGKERSLMWVRLRRIVEMDEADQLMPHQSVSSRAPTRRRDRRARPPPREWTALRPWPTRRLQAHPSTPPGVLVATCPYQGTQRHPYGPPRTKEAST